MRCDNPVLDSQKVFRAALDALARPGRIARLSTTVEPPFPLLPACRDGPQAVMVTTPDWSKRPLDPNSGHSIE
jgi:alpha-D-ribose 1-methylphosphonate 5-triphosphate synthase subunit PhnH